MDEYDPNDSAQHDDILDALSMGILGVNPALRQGLTVDGDFEVMDESEYKMIKFGGCP
jgi:hypothetical protein